MDKHANLRLIASPPAVVLGSALARISNHRGIVFDIPPTPRLPNVRAKWLNYCNVLGRRAHPIDERLPHLSDLCFAEALAYHRHYQRVIGPQRHLLAPMRIE